MNIRDMLKATGFKSQALITVEPDAFVSTAINKLSEHNKGALPVCNYKNELIGIITERDIVRKCFVGGAEFTNKKIMDIMTKEVAVATLDDDLDYAVTTMKKGKIRHLPIMDERKVVGIISMRDILGFQYAETKTEIKYINLLPKRPLFK
jgi:CBS domain-containing protein